MLVLFDIDHTLLSTGGAGMNAMLAAGKELFGERFTVAGVSFAGSLDPVIIGEMFARSGVTDTIESRKRFRLRYSEVLQTSLADRASVARALPGAVEATRRVAALPHATCGLLTGNFRETGEMKLRAVGIDPGAFRVPVWGDDSTIVPPLREHLVPVAQSRWRAIGGSGDSSRVVVIGDTPHDVVCAMRNGCRSIAVATGRSSADELRAAGADRVLADLSDTDRVMSLIHELAGY